MGMGEYIKRSGGLVKGSGMKSVKIALLSNFTVTGLAETMRCLCFDRGVYAESYTAHYNQYAQDILDSSSGLYNFGPDVIFMLLDVENFLGDFIYFPYRMSSEQRKEFIKKRFEEIKILIENLKAKTASKIVINNLLVPFYSSRGIVENKQGWGLKRSVQNFNSFLEEFAMGDSQLFVFDVNSFYMKRGHEEVCDRKMCYLGDLKISPGALTKLASEYMGYVSPLLSLTKKCIVLDLDNTLWGGIVGEDGLDKIRLGPEKEGRPFLDFQKRLLELFERGVILAINSKNNYDDAIEVLRNHRYMILKEDNFACIKINWSDKATNLKDIANELNIGLDSLVFIDDDRANRELVRSMLPEVLVVDLPEDPVFYCKALEDMQVFNLFSLTDDDLKRGKMYADQKRREEFKSKAVDIDSFIRQLEIKAEIVELDSGILPRATQLTQKTNQFNLTTRRYQEEDIRHFMESDDYLIKCVDVSDRFGDYGLTGEVIVKKCGGYWEIDTFLLSCRVLGKKIEFTLMQDIIDGARAEGIEKIRGRFIQTKKNMPAKTFLEDCGFTLSKVDNGEVVYDLEVGKEKVMRR